MELINCFNDMLTEIRPPQDLLDECVKAHTELRETLMSCPELKGVVVTTFLQGSYRRSTLTRPAKGSKPDVDVVVVTSLDPNAWTSARVQDAFCRVLDKYPAYRQLPQVGPVNRIDARAGQSRSGCHSCTIGNPQGHPGARRHRVGTLSGDQPFVGAQSGPAVSGEGLEGGPTAYPRPRRQPMGADRPYIPN